MFLVPLPNELSILAVVLGIRIVLSWSLSKEIDRHNVDLLESGTQPIAGRKTTTIFSYIKKIDKKEGGGEEGGGEEGGGEDKSSHNRANSKRSASEKEQ